MTCVPEDQLLSEFPPDHELLAFFAAEPKVLDSGAPWIYNTLDFVTTRDGIEVRCRIEPSYGQFTACLLLAGVELAKFELREVEAFRLLRSEKQEVLVATFSPGRRLDNFALQLKPRVWAA